MRKYLLIVSVLFVCFNGAFSQSPEKLLKILPTLKGKARIDCLIEIRTHYSYMGVTKSDSAFYYSALAYDEATKLGYKKGIAFSLLGLKPESDSLQLLNVKKAIEIGEEIKDNEVLGWAYYKWPPQPKDNWVERMKKSISYFQKSGNILREAEITNWFCMSSNLTGEEEGFDYCQRSVELSKKIKSSVKGWESWGQYLYNFSLMNMSSLYEQGGDYSAAMDLLRMARQSAIGTSSGMAMEGFMSPLFNKMGQYDSSLYYLQIFSKTNKGPFVNALFGETYFLKNEYQLAQQKFQQAIDSSRNTTKYPALMKALLGIGKVYEVKKEYETALKSVNEGLTIKRTSPMINNQFTMDSYELLSRLHHQLGKNDSAYYYLLQYTTMKDSANNRQFLWKLNMKLNNYKRAAEDAKKEAKIGFLNRDNKIKEQQLKQEASFKKFLLIGLLLLFIASVFIVRTLLLKRKNEKLKSLQLENELRLQQLENEKRQTEFQKKTTELEMQALRAQMNPHFIFNCLSSINRFILKNEPDTASDYLTRFSRLIRMVLMNSQKSLITLEDELDMLTIYLDMERLRFKNTFDYHIIFTNRVDAGAINIPPLLLQPFCENAIWHGLKHLADPQSGRHEHGRLDIVLSMEDKVLYCSITDNGIGRQKAAEIKSKSAEENKSMGLKITTERLALLNQQKENLTSFEIIDLKNEKGETAGTCVKLKIFLSETVEENA